MQDEKKRKARSWKALWWVLVPVTICAVFLLWQNGKKSRNVPDKLIGTWRTSDTKYAGRSFEIGLVTINFGTGEGQSNTGFIDKIEGVPDGGGTVYTISYVEDGLKNQCTFYYSEQKDNTIVFANQPNIPWRKVAEP